MKRYEAALRRRGEQGQVLILAVVALILVVLAVLLLFDVQTIIRGKVKAQNGVDAAALTGAEWQKHSLNMIGELNLVRAAGTLISDPFFANGIMNDPNSNASEFFADIPRPITQEKFTQFPEKEEFYNGDGSVNIEKLIQEVIRVEKEKRYLDALNKLVSQLQTRISFVGPLIGFGAAQQAAKNNGVTYDEDASDFFVTYLNLLGEEGIYENITPVFINDYAWRMPYTSMLSSILDYSAQHNDYTDRTETRSYGIAAATNIEFAGMPILVTNPPTDFSNLLGKKSFYEMIHARDWCGLYHLLRQDFDRNWWGDFEVDFDQNFSGQSEILPLHITFSDSIDTYEGAYNEKALTKYLRKGETPFSETFNREEPYQYTVNDEVVKRQEFNGRNRTYYTLTSISITLDQSLDTYNDQDADRRYDLLPRLSWATFDEKWKAYDSEKSDWEEYLRGKFKPGMDYRSGALAFFEARQQTVTVSGSMGRPRRGSRAPDIGQVFSTSATNGEAARVSAALNRINNTSSLENIETNAEAKPIGRIRKADGTFIRPFEAGRMILPVFTETALIPIALEPVEGFSMLDIAWLYYLTEFVPLLSGSPSIQDAWDRASKLYPRHLHYFSYYVSALNLLDKPEFRKAGMEWLESPAIWTKDANGNKRVLYSKLEHECYGLGKPSSHGVSIGGGGGGGGGGGHNNNGGGSGSKQNTGPSRLH